MSQARAEVTRNAVLSSAARVFETKGYAGASIQDILEEASVTKGALYFHFPSKAALASAIIEQQSNWRVSNTKPAPLAVQQVIDLSFRFVAALQADPLVRASIRLTLERNTFMTRDSGPYEDWIAGVLHLVQLARDGGELRPEVDPEVVANVLVSALTGTQLLSEAISGRSDLAERVVDLWQLLLPGLVPPKIHKKLDPHEPNSRAKAG